MSNRWETELKRCKRFLLPVFKKFETYNWSDVVENVRQGRWFLLALPNSALLIEFLQYPKKRVLYVLAAGGKLEEILKTENDVISIAKEMNCSSIEVRGRLGFEKIAKQFKGWKKQYTVISKELI
tara:strand:+ start:116 stop:490 length:375 start_codon:yes stop_codon:yes gene_type:complete